MPSFLSFDGFKIEGAAFVVTPLFAAILAFALRWPRTSLSDFFVERLPVPVKHVPAFAIMWVVTIWLLTIIVYFMSVARTRRGGYNNKSPRDMAKDKSLGWMYRLHCAHDNTTECLVWLIATVTVAEKLRLDATLVAKWTALIAATRTLYPFFYVFNVDALRTTVYAIGFFSAFTMGWVAIFQESMLPYCT